jgi:hypothetical protein
MPIESLEQVLGAEVTIEPLPEDDARLRAVMAVMEREDHGDTSTITCICGASFTWSFAPDDLTAFVREHAEHYSWSP